MLRIIRVRSYQKDSTSEIFEYSSIKGTKLILSKYSNEILTSDNSLIFLYKSVENGLNANIKYNCVKKGDLNEDRRDILQTLPL